MEPGGGQAKVNRKAGEEAKDGVLLGMMIEKGYVKTLRGKSGPTRCDDAETTVIAVKYGCVCTTSARRAAVIITETGQKLSVSLPPAYFQRCDCSLMKTTV